MADDILQPYREAPARRALLSDEEKAALDAQLKGALNLAEPNMQSALRLLEAGANPDLVLQDSIPALHLAVRMASWAKYFVAAGADVAALDADGNNALHYVHRTSDLHLLVEAGTPLLQTNKYGQTPLQLLEENRIHSPSDVATNSFDPYVTLKLCTAVARMVEEDRLDFGGWQEACSQAQEGLGQTVDNGKMWRDQANVFPYFLQAMEAQGKFVDKDECIGSEARAIDLCHNLMFADGSKTVAAWMRHCDLQGKPMAIEDVEALGFERWYEYCAAHALFDAAYWAEQPSLDRMVEIYNGLPEKSREWIDTREPPSYHNPGQAFSQWMEQRGEDVQTRSIATSYAVLPKSVQARIPNFRQRLVTLQRREQSLAEQNAQGRS